MKKKTIIVLCSLAGLFIACSSAQDQDVLTATPPLPPIPDAGKGDTNIPDTGTPIDAAPDTNPPPPPPCVPEQDITFCLRYQTSCGALIGIDNCGANKTVVSCGVCKTTEACNAGSCSTLPCVPETDLALCATAAKTCGAISIVDNCGVIRTPNCGTCQVGNFCVANTCCVPKTCGALNCGTISDYCGNVVLCGPNAGACTGVDVCTNNMCVPPACVPETDLAFCARLGDNCGAVSAPDNCGTIRSTNCGTCAANATCTNNKCVSCVPETDLAFCSRLGDNCGSVSAPDNCGIVRATNCGSCIGNDACTNNKCVACVPKTCGALNCGTISNGCGGTITCGPNAGQCTSPNSCIANTCSPNMVDHGGRVMPTMNLYAIYWGAGFSATTPSLYQSFLTGLGGSPYAATNTQYLRGAANNIHYAGSFADTTTPLAASITDADLHSEINRVISAGSLPYDANGFYIVITPKTTQVCTGANCSCTQFCGYHSAYPDPLARTIIYASIPSAAACPGGCGITFFTDATSPNGNVEADEGVSILAHEIMEAQSDTLPLTGWYDASGGVGEVGDKCAYQYGALNGAKTNQSWGGFSWLVQENWSNATSSCVKF